MCVSVFTADVTSFATQLGPGGCLCPIILCICQNVQTDSRISEPGKCYEVNMPLVCFGLFFRRCPWPWTDPWSHWRSGPGPGTGANKTSKGVSRSGPSEAIAAFLCVWLFVALMYDFRVLPFLRLCFVSAFSIVWGGSAYIRLWPFGVLWRFEERMREIKSKKRKEEREERSKRGKRRWLSLAHAHANDSRILTFLWHAFTSFPSSYTILLECGSVSSVSEQPNKRRYGKYGRRC